MSRLVKEAGKGDKPRAYSISRWDRNFDAIRFKSKRSKKCEKGGKSNAKTLR